MKPSLLPLLAACGPCAERPDRASPSTVRTAVGMDVPGAPAAWRALDHLGEASFSLPAHNLVEGVPSDGVYPLAGTWNLETRARNVGLYSTALPVQVPAKRYRGAPAGIEVRVGEEALPFRKDLDRAEVARRSWSLIGERLWLASEQHPDELGAPVTLVRGASSDQQRRLAWSLAGLAAPEFVSYVATLGPETRTCLLLPAPATATWRATVPDDATLRMGLGIRPRVDLSLPESDGVTFEVRVDGEIAWAETITPAARFEDVDVDLARWADREVELTLATLPGASSASDLALLSSPIVTAGRAAEARRVVVVGIDTLRFGQTGVAGYARDTTPELDAWSAGAYVFERSYAPAPRTKPSFRTAFTGAYPLPAVDAPTFGQVLRAEGFFTGGLSANVHLVPRFGFSDGFDTWNYDNGAKADVQVDRALAWLERFGDVDSALFVHLMDPHIFYDAPGRFKNMFVQQQAPLRFPRRFNRWDLARMQRTGQLDDVEREFVKARYDGEVRYLSHELDRLLTALDALPGRTLVVVHSDHGEELWEHGGFEHNHSLYDELVRTVLWVRPPGGWAGGPHRIDDQVGLIDLAPTLYDLLGVPVDRWPAMAGTSLAPLLDPARAAGEADLRARLDDRPQHVGYLMYDKERWGVIWRQGKYLLQTASGAEELYDLAADPGEQRDLAAERAADLPAWRQRLAQATGWPVGPGLRVKLMGRGSAPFDLVFPVPVAEAGVIDPEADRVRRANIEWGEVPRVTPEQVAAVALSEDRSRVTIAPGAHPSGVVYVLFGAQVPAGLRLEAGGMGRELGLAASEQSFNGARLRIEPGTIIAPRDDLAERLAVDEGDADDLEALRALGYVE